MCACGNICDYEDVDDFACIDDGDSDEVNADDVAYNKSFDDIVCWWLIQQFAKTCFRIIWNSAKKNFQNMDSVFYILWDIPAKLN